jgi:diguanylate cyclase (GGDEF)-like protein
MPLKDKLIRDIMIKDIITVEYNSPVEDAGDLMVKNRIGSLVVLKNKKPIGILTERDFVKLISSDFSRNSGVIVDDIILPKLITATPSTTFTKAFRTLNTYGIKRLPVTSKNRLVGLITLRQMLIHSRNILIDMLDENRHLQKEVNKDELTKTFNKRYLMRRLDDEYNRVRRYGSKLCIIFIDIDHFKEVNDTYSHFAGDYVLREMSKIFRKNIRSTDFIARFGGEEFVIVTPNTKAFEASYLANKLRVTIEKSVFKYKRKQMKITISGGVATFSAVKSVGEALEHADKALYQAKNTGRNKVCRWRNSTSTIANTTYHKRSKYAKTISVFL